MTTLHEAVNRAIQLCQWISESPHQRGSINGMAAQVQHELASALAQQGEQQLFVTGCSCKKDEFCDECSPDIFDTAPAAQPGGGQ